MAPIVLERRADANGVLHFDLPLGPDGAGRQLRVTVEPLGPPAEMTAEEWRAGILATAGGWVGEFERPVDPPPTDPEWMNDPNYAGFVKISDYPAGESPGAGDDPSGVRRNQPDRSDRRS